MVVLILIDVNTGAEDSDEVFGSKPNRCRTKGDDP